MQIADELENIENEGGGLNCKIGRGKTKKMVFLKSSPSVISNTELLKSVDVSIETYRKNFLNVEDVNKEILMYSMASHPQHDEIVDWFNI